MRFCLLGLFFVVMPLSSEEFGIGVLFGDSSGINIHKVLNDRKTYSFTLSWKSSRDSYFILNSDRLINIKRVYERKGYEPEYYFLYYGFGVGLIFDDGADISIRVPLGVRKNFERLEVFFQLTPYLKIINETKGDMDIGFGIRYYFI